MLAGVGFAAFARGAIDAADSMTLLQSKLRLVTNGQSELARVQEQIIDLARETRTEIGPVGELYARVARSSQQLGASQEQVLTVTKAVSQAIQISGATSSEAAAGVVQLAQALASGTLRGDELRSVMEQMPRVAEAIAKGLGVTIGQLRELGAQGRLTSDQVFRALISQSETLNAEFRKLRPTVGQSFTVLKNELRVATAEALEATGVTGGLTAALRGLAAAIRGITSLAEETKSFFQDFKRDISELFDTIENRSPVAARAIEKLGEAAISSLPVIGPALNQITQILDRVPERRRTRGPTGAQRRGGAETPLVFDERPQLEEVSITARRVSQEVPDFLRQMSDATRTETERLVDDFNELRESLAALRSEGLITAEQSQARLSEALDNLLPEFDLTEIRKLYIGVRKETNEVGEFMKGVWQGVGNSIRSTISDALYEWDFSFKSLVDIARRALADIASAIITSGIKNLLTEQLTASAAGGGGGFWSGLASLFIGGSAGGGRFDRPRIVGEEGPELVMGSGQVFNRRQLAFAGMGSSINFSPVNNFNIIERENPEQTKNELREEFALANAQQQSEFIRILQRSGVEVRG